MNISQIQNYLPENKYMKHYLLLVQKRQAEILDKRGNHVHHILPKSKFPDYRTERWNLITLTPREHFIAHILLWKGTEWKEMQQAMWLMNNDSSTHCNKRVTGKQYQILQDQIRPIYSELMSKCMKGKVLCADHFGEKHWVDISDRRINAGELIRYQKYRPNGDASHLPKDGRYLKSPNKGDLPIYDMDGKFHTINASDFNPEIHKHITAGKTNIILPNGRRMKIDAEIYDPKIHKHVNSGKMNAVDVATGKIVQADVNDTRFETGELEKYKNSYVGSEHHRQILLERNRISRVWIKHSDGRSISVLPEDVENYISDGWELGRHLKMSNDGKANMIKRLQSRTWLYKGETNKIVYDEKVEDYLKDGWSKGRFVPSGSNKELKNFIWLYKGETNARVHKDKVDDYLKDGWVRGMIKSNKKKKEKPEILVDFSTVSLFSL